MLFLTFVLTGLAAYLVGSIPTGYLVARARGIDIRGVGSGNIGATNVFRALGRKAGVLVLAVDYLKGWIGCGWVPIWVGWLMGGSGGLEAGPGESLYLVAGVSAILGHIYTCWLGFRGGKGIATSAGVLTSLLPLPFLIILVVWLVVFGLWRYVSLASVSAAATLPVAVWVTGGSAAWILTTTGLAGLAIYKHRSNLGRLRAGTEPRVQGGRGEPGS